MNINLLIRTSFFEDSRFLSSINVVWFAKKFVIASSEVFGAKIINDANNEIRQVS